MPTGPNSVAAVLLRPRIPHFVAEYDGIPATPLMPAPLETFTIEPPGRVRTRSWARWQFIVPVKLTARVLSQSSWICISGQCQTFQDRASVHTMFAAVVSGCRIDNPATFAAPSSFPNALIASSIHLSTSSALDTSTVLIKTWLLYLSSLLRILASFFGENHSFTYISFLVTSKPARLRSQRVTPDAPISAHLIAVARPIPEPAPVIA